MNAAIVTGCFALGGVVLTYAGQVTVATRTARQAKAERWTERRHEKHAAFLAAGDAWQSRLEPRILGIETSPLPLDEFAHLREAFAFALADLELVADDPASEAAGDWYSSLISVFVMLEHTNSKTRAKTREAARDARIRYMTAARQELGTRTGTRRRLWR